MASNYRSPEAAAWRKLYKTARWEAVRQHQFNSEPLCEWCMAKKPKIIRPATVVHHAKPDDKSDPMLFFGGKLVSLCKPCHDGEAHRMEARGYSDAIDETGWPSDPDHPANLG
jgi:5-methylcytosine-specific restriction endonuclease McrA